MRYYYIDIVEKFPVDKGWSADKKYRAITASGETYLLRIGPKERVDRLGTQHLRMCEAAKLGIPMSLPLEEGTCAQGPYLIQSWIDGMDAEEMLPTLSEQQQYAYGLEAGRILRKIHSIPAPGSIKPWDAYYNHKIDRKLSAYADCPLKYENGEKLVQYVQDHRHLLQDRPQTFQHGDYHCGNLLIDSAGQLTVIDFDKCDYGDPWEEFNRIVWCAQCSPAFASGRVDGYFDGQVPEEFWQLLALYISVNCIGSLPWAIPFGESEIRVMQKQAAEILKWYDDFQSVIPRWYHKPGGQL